MIDKPSDDDDFNLNKFDSGVDNSSEENKVFVETESFYTADLFTDDKQQDEPERVQVEPFASSWEVGRTGDFGDGKKEPVFVDMPEPEASTSIEESNAIDESEMRVENTAPDAATNTAFEEPAIPSAAQPDSMDTPKSAQSN
ncbi:MAG: hypothetical protein ACE5E3_01735, partial [Mariprofundus sp.]